MYITGHGFSFALHHPLIANTMYLATQTSKTSLFAITIYEFDFKMYARIDAVYH